MLLGSDKLDVDLRTREGDTALCLALLADPFFENAAARLLARGATSNPNYPDETLLHRLAREGREDAALFLLQPFEESGDENEGKM